MDDAPTTLLPNLAPVPAPSRVLDGRYEVFEALSEGAVARTYRAWDHQLQHVVVVKRLKPPYSEDRGTAHAFEESARRVAALPTHRSVATVYDLGHDGNAPYVAMEYVPGESLRELMTREGTLPVGRAFALAREVAEALDFAARYGLTHGNLRPEHILVARSGQVKIIDFGTVVVSELTRPLFSPSTGVQAPYMSPEQIRGGLASAAGDIYSLGVVLYEMLTGRLPLETGDPLERAAQELAEPVPDPTTLNPAISPGAAALVMEALAREPSERFSSPGSFAAALRQYLALEKGETARAELPHMTVVPSPPPQPVPVMASRARPLPGRAPGVNLGLSALFLGALAVAVLGGWVVYRAVAGAMTGPGYPSASAGCTGTHTGPVQLRQAWIQSKQLRPGGLLTADYRIANNGGQCSRTLLGMTLVSAAHPGAPLLDRSHARVVSASPGSHVYRRSFTLPASAAGQSFDVVLSVSDPSRAHVYARSRLVHALTVTGK